MSSYYEKVDGIERCIDDELPFEIPESWEWVHFFSVVEIATNLVSPERYFDYLFESFRRTNHHKRYFWTAEKAGVKVWH